MLTDYVIIVAAVAALSILWRMLKDDHPAFKQFIKELPLVGEALSCGVCVSFWFSLPAVVFANPLGEWKPVLMFGTATIEPIVVFFAGWLSVGVGVLFFRSAVIVLLELGAILKHRHTTNHQ